jgi:hypothetical protein
MAEVIVKTTYNSGWNVGDHVELTGKELEKRLESKDVELVNKPEEAPKEEPKEEKVVEKETKKSK